MAEVTVKETQFQGIYTCETQDGTTRLCTKNLAPGHSVYGERLFRVKGIEYREWNAFRSKLAGAILKGLNEVPIAEGTKVLYLGAASGTTPSHVSDIVGKEGKVYAVEFSARIVRELLLVAQERPNIFPILADARFPNAYAPLIEDVEVLYVDIAQPDQTDIAIRNARQFLKPGGHMLLAVKARSIDVTKDPREIFKAEEAKLRDAGFAVKEIVNLEPYDKDHAMILAKYG
ncbi:MAG: fibrillarin-like rRNA/tRNA 2'-O-methyltransferase [Thermoprotei archaeon]